jgi:oxalate decarboxylase/phosphoglucose isomerase-like protein (cupin superfamily)
MTQIIGELGTNESQSFILRNYSKGTSVIITNSYKHNSNNQLDTFLLQIPFDVSKDDELEIKWQTPSFEITPTIVRHNFNVNVEY